MLRWIAYIKSLNPDIRHISGKDNAMVDMLLKAQFEDRAVESEEEEAPEDYFTSENVFRVCGICEYLEEEYEGEALQIGRMLQGKENPDSRKDICKRERQTRTFFLEDGLLWTHSHLHAHLDYTCLLP